VSPRDPCTTILLCSTYTLYSPPLTFCGLCAISVGIFSKALIGLLVKSLIVGHIDGVWSRTLCLCLRTAALLLFANQGVHLQHLWFSSISYWTSLCLVSAGAACLTSRVLRQLDNTSFFFGYSHRRLKSIDLRDNIGPPSLRDHSLAQENFRYHVKAASLCAKR
jgi:hypothetical protein